MKKYGKHTIFGWMWRTLLWCALTPFLLFVLLAALLYFPPVQKYAANKAAEILGEEMGMEVSVGELHLKCPLDLSIGNMLAVQEGDTVLNAEELRLSVQVRPLLRSMINVDNIILRNADVNTREFIDALLIKGHVGELQAYTHGVDLAHEYITVNKLDISNSDILLALPDTVAPDTVESEPTKLKIDFQDIKIHNLKFALSLPQGKSYGIDALCRLSDVHESLNTHFAEAGCKVLVDLENSMYELSDVHINNSSVKFEESVNLKNVSFESDSLCYSDPLNLFVSVKAFSGNEECGLAVKELTGKVRMDSLNIYLDDLDILTDDSKIKVGMKMPFDTWEDENPGIMLLDLNASFGKSDMLCLTRYVDRYLEEGAKLEEVRKLIRDHMPSTPMMAQASVVGNLSDLQVDDIRASIKGLCKLDGSVRMRGNELSAKVHAGLLTGDAEVRGLYNMAEDSYDVDLALEDFGVSSYVDIGEKTLLTGTVHAKGKGFDFYSPKTYLDAVVNITKGNYGKVDLSAINASVSLKESNLGAVVSSDNSQLKTDFNLSGVMRKDAVDGSLDIQLPHADVHAMGYSEKVLTISTRGKIDFYSNLNDVFKIQSFIDASDLKIGEETIKTRTFNLYAESQKDTTVAHLTTGDLDCNFSSPSNVFAILKHLDRMDAAAQKQMTKNEVNLNELKEHMPVTTINLNAGKNNVIARVLNTFGMRFGDLVLKLDTSPEAGITGFGHITELYYDTIRIDSAYFDIYQDSSYVAFNSGVTCTDQPMFPAFHASLNGYYGITEADMRLQLYDKNNELGMDLGVHIDDRDSVFHSSFYPKEPIIGHRKFELNDSNYFDIYKGTKRPILGNVAFISTDKKSHISLVGLEDEGNQRALVEVSGLDLGELSKVIPFFPNVEGQFGIDAAYQEKDGTFWVDGMADINGFVYENIPVGNLGTMFTYEPEGTDFKIHKVDCGISFNGDDIASLKGSYDVANEGYLDADLSIDDLPLRMISAFVPDQMANLDGFLHGKMSVEGPTDNLDFNGYAVTDGATVALPYYSVNLRLQNDTLRVDSSKIKFDRYEIYGAGENPLMVNGIVNFQDLEKIQMSLSVSGRNVELVNSARSPKAIIFGKAYGDVYARLTSADDDLEMRGYVNVHPNTDLTYIMDDSAISQGDRLEDIVTFTNFELLPDTTSVKEEAKIMGVNMQMTMNVEDGAKFRAEFSANKQSYVSVRCGGSLRVNYTPEGVLSAQGRLTVNDGEMKYTLPIIPLKTFILKSGSYVEFTGDVMNPTLNITATERTKAQVGNNGESPRSVVFDVGLVITQTLQDMGLSFTISAPEDMATQESISHFNDEEKYKLAVALLATGMYMDDTNSSAINANNALSSFLQSQINNLTSRAFGSFIDVSLGMDNQTYSDGSTGKDYSFKFSKRFFNDRLGIVIGGRVSDNNEWNKKSNFGSFIDNVSLEWRLDESATRYVHLFHKREYDNIVDGVLEKNGAGIVIRKKLSKFSDIIFWKKKPQEAVVPMRQSERRTTSPSGTDEDARALKEKREEEHE